MTRAFLSALALAALAMACEFHVSNPPGPGPIAVAEERGEQAEVDATVAQTPTGVRAVVAGYRYTGSNPLFNNPANSNDIEYATDGSDGVVVHRFASIAGWSHSENGGLTWSAPGKIYPPTTPTGPGDAMAIYWGDPGLSTGDRTPSLVAYSFLGGSKDLFDSKVEIGDVVRHWPAIDLIDSICVAISTDGGASFPNHAICKTPPGSRVAGTDQNSVAYAYGDQLFVTTTNLDTARLLLYQVDPVSGFRQLSIDARMNGATITPRLRRDNEGRLWLAAATEPPPGTPGEIRMCLVQPAQLDLTGSCQFAGVITSNTLVTPVAGPGSSIGPVRVGESFDFGAIHEGFPATTGGRTTFTFAYHTPPMRFDTKLHVGIAQCTWDRGLSPALFFDSTNFHCADLPALGTSGAAGQQFQPRVEAVDLSAAHDGSLPDVRYAYYQFDDGSIASDHVRVLRSSNLASTSSSPTFSAIPGATPGTTVRDPQVCPANYATPDFPQFYWGDYFAFRLLPPVGAERGPTHLAVYSSDEGQGCTVPQANRYQGRTLHVVAGAWPD